MAHLAAIRLFPIKAMDGEAREQATFLSSGALEWDRRFALFDSADKFVNGKRHAAVHLLGSQFDAASRRLRLWRRDSPAVTFHVDHERQELQAWLSDYFTFPVTLKENPDIGFPDDTDAPGPTLISTATLETVASWFDGLSVEQARRRFRANLEIGGVPPFWEDHLYGQKGTRVRFSIGEATIDGNNPCQRCAVPPRDPDTGEPIEKFSVIFRQKRRETLPPWAEQSRFDHFYRLAINTVVPPDQAGKIIRLGDAVTILK
jgi:uncharacterized protein YcbX